MTITERPTGRHHAATTNHPVKELALDIAAAALAVWFVIIPFLFVGALILSALVTGGGR